MTTTVLLKVSPTRDATAPHRFTAQGILKAATRFSCTGTVKVLVKKRTKKVMTKKARLRTRAGKCRYTTTIRFRTRPATKLTISTRYPGTTTLTPARSRPVTIRLR